ncbi:MAG: AAA family ATPase [Gemmatimonadota bacterium]
MSQTLLSGDELESQTEKIQQAASFVEPLRRAVARRVVGQEAMIDGLLISLLTGGHVLLEGVPGLAKTLAVQSLADAIDTGFQRIQFTPDLLPADLIGTLVWDEGTREFVPKLGPIFSNLILADEINRAPAKVQSALLEAMQERQVTIGNSTYELPEPFLVLATQNPLEHEGTYPLPEAQVDRFMLKIRVFYPGREEEREIMRRMTGDALQEIEVAASPATILEARDILPDIHLDTRIEDYILDLVAATRDLGQVDEEMSGWLEYGASPRATIFLARTARAQAFLQGRAYVIPEDVQRMVPDVLRHRLVLTFQAEAEDVTTDDVLERLLEKVAVP